MNCSKFVDKWQLTVSVITKDCPGAASLSCVINILAGNTGGLFPVPTTVTVSVATSVLKYYWF